MNENVDMKTIENRLIEEINKLSNQLNFAVGEREASHSLFLQEVIDDLRQKLESVRRGNQLVQSS
jgi:hypothetical protein